MPQTEVRAASEEYPLLHPTGKFLGRQPYQEKQANPLGHAPSATEECRGRRSIWPLDLLLLPFNRDLSPLNSLTCGAQLSVRSRTSNWREDEQVEEEDGRADKWAEDGGGLEGRGEWAKNNIRRENEDKPLDKMRQGQARPEWLGDRNRWSSGCWKRYSRCYL